MLPIPGTGSIDHLIENCEAGRVHLTAEQMSALDTLPAPA
jgi:aryl-alcohol dehydrogenase-like predicted oxidoreductase